MHSSLEQILAKENLYTLLQTISKWNASSGKIKQAEYNFQEMINLDLHDSTAYSGYAFLLFDEKRYLEASIYFKLAYYQGPPAVGMNLYYYAQCLELSGHNKREIVNILYEVTEIDTDALSPWLDIFQYAKNINDMNQTKKIAVKILSNTTLYEQLTTNEYLTLSEVIQ